MTACITADVNKLVLCVATMHQTGWLPFEADFFSNQRNRAAALILRQPVKRIPMPLYGVHAFAPKA